MASTTRSNDAYAYAGAANRDDGSGINGLNQATSVGATSLGYDAKGNIASIGGSSYQYTSQNRLANVPGSSALYADSLERLDYISSENVLIGHDGAAAVTEEAVTTGYPIARRYVFGAGADEPLVEYDASGARTWLHADERGSVVARTNDAGNATAINRYDEYGVPGAGNVGRFGYTGQAWLPSVGLWYYKARMYAPSLGRFLQTDPVGYGAGMNWYGYAGGDPVNATDPSGLAAQSTVGNNPRCKDLGEDPTHQCDIIITGTRMGGGINLLNYPVEWGYGPISYRPGDTGVVFDTPPSGPASVGSDSPLPINNQSLCSPNGYYKAMGPDGKAICWPTPNTPPATPKLPKKPSRLEQCLTNAAEDYANGDIHLEKGPRSTAGGARTSIGNPFRKDGMLTPGPTALGFLGNLFRAIGYHIGASCELGSAR